MHISLTFIRILFFCLCILLCTAYTTTQVTEGSYFSRLSSGLLIGSAFAGALIALELNIKSFSLRIFNIATLGLLFGYLMGEALLLLIQAVLDATSFPVLNETMTQVRIGIFLFSAYFGMVLTAKASEEWSVSLPFIKFKPSNHKKRDRLMDASVILDPRMIDLATSGLLDHQLILPRFILKELYDAAENGDEAIKLKARRCTEIVKKLENIPTLGLRYAEVDFPETKDSLQKLVKLAQLLEADIFTSDVNRIQQSTLEGVRVINLNILSTALKPVAQTGECINIKIQRYGKEARQGVGYLDDGTMVVINGGAEFIGEVVKAQVLSVKHTSSGRMIFCNAIDDSLLGETAFATSPAEDDMRNWSAPNTSTSTSTL